MMENYEEYTQDGIQSQSGDCARHGQSSKLQLPASCDPPGPSNPPKQLVWIVSLNVFFVNLHTTKREHSSHYYVIDRHTHLSNNL